MPEQKEIKIGDVLEMKKPHPCGSFQWEVLRVGMDFRLKCCGCGRMILLPRGDVMKRMKKIVSSITDGAEEKQK